MSDKQTYEDLEAERDGFASDVKSLRSKVKDLEAQNEKMSFVYGDEIKLLKRAETVEERAKKAEKELEYLRQTIREIKLPPEVL